MASEQRGFSMIGLMVGMLVSVLGVVAVLSLYRNLIPKALESIQWADSAGSMLSATLSMQMALQGAGYGRGSAAAGASPNNDLVVLSGAAFSGTALTGTAVPITSAAAAAGNAIVWDENPSFAAIQCNALLLQGGGILLLHASGSCVNATAWNALSWQKTSNLIRASLLGGTTVFKVQNASCSAYGRGAPVATLKATLWQDGTPWQSGMCLSNFAGA